MSRFADDQGMTLVELLVTLTVTLIVFSAALSGLEYFQRANAAGQRRNESQDQARSSIDRLAFELRNVAAPSAGTAGTLEQAGSYSLVFQTVDASQISGGQNVANKKRVRYCLDASSPSSEIVWKQEQRWTSATAPAIPSTTACPDPAWGNQVKLVLNVTNTINGRIRPVFTYDPGSNPSPAQISSVQADLFIDLAPGSRPGESELSSGMFLRNSNRAPTAAFTATQVNGHVLLNASTASSPNGQALTYQWSLDSSPISGATTQQYDLAGLLSGSTHAVSLTVSDPGGLTGSTQNTVIVQ